MTDLCLERVSLILTELRNENNHELVTLCLGEIENIQRKSQQENFISCFGTQEIQLLEYYEKRNSEAEKVILRLEEELEELKSRDQHSVQYESSNILVERSIFWKDQNNVETPKLPGTPPKQYLSPRALKEFLVDIEFKTLNNEKENEYHLSQIRHLEKMNSQYQDQIEEIRRNQLEDALEKESNNKSRILQLTEEKENAIMEISSLKSEVEFLRRRLTDTEKELKLKISSNSIVEARAKVLEEKNFNLIATIQEIYQENQNLTAEKREFEEKFQITYEEIKEKAILHMPSPEQRKLFMSINNLALKSPIASSQNGMTPQQTSAPRSNLVRTKTSNKDYEEDQNNLKYDTGKVLNVSKFQEKFDDEEKIVFNTLEDFLRLSNEESNLENDFIALSVNDICRQTLSEKTKSVLSLIQEEEEETMFRAQDAPMSERIILPKNEKERSDRKDRLRGCLTMGCNMF